jgi:uncharacterized protein (DUF1330 family)
MTSIDPTRAQIDAFLTRDLSQPVTMLNLMRFRDKAGYEKHPSEPSRTGAEAYGVYMKMAGPIVERHGGRPIVAGPAAPSVIGPETEAWDLVLLVAYPKAQAFINMIQDPDYQAIVYHRTAAIADSRLIPMFDARVAGY